MAAQQVAVGVQQLQKLWSKKDLRVSLTSQLPWIRTLRMCVVRGELQVQTTPRGLAPSRHLLLYYLILTSENSTPLLELQASMKEKKM